MCSAWSRDPNEIVSAQGGGWNRVFLSFALKILICEHVQNRSELQTCPWSNKQLEKLNFGFALYQSVLLPLNDHRFLACLLERGV